MDKAYVSGKNKSGVKSINKMKAVGAVSVVVSAVLAVIIVVMYLNFTALVQQQSDLIKGQADEIHNLREGLDNMISITNDLWDNAPLPDIKTDSAAQESYFQPPD